MLSLALCAIVVARVVCPCASVTAEHAVAVESANATEHGCCGKQETPTEPSPMPCEKHGKDCTHCGMQLAPSDKTVEVSQITVAPALLSAILDPLPAPTLSLVRPEPRLTDPSPPSLLALHCVLVI